MFTRVVVRCNSTHLQIEVQSRIDSLSLIKHLLLHVEMLLQVWLTLLLLVTLIIDLTGSVDTDRLWIVEFVLRLGTLATAVMAVRCVCVSFWRLSFHAWQHRRVLLVWNRLILCGLTSNDWTISVCHVAKHQVIEILWLAWFLIAGSLRAWSEILSHLYLVLDNQWRVRLLYVRRRSCWVAPFLFVLIPRVMVAEPYRAIATRLNLIVLWASMLVHLGVRCDSFWLRDGLLCHTWVLCRAWSFWLDKVSWVLIDLDSQFTLLRQTFIFRIDPVNVKFLSVLLCKMLIFVLALLLGWFFLEPLSLLGRDVQLLLKVFGEVAKWKLGLRLWIFRWCRMLWLLTRALSLLLLTINISNLVWWLLVVELLRHVFVFDQFDHFLVVDDRISDLALASYLKPGRSNLLCLIEIGYVFNFQMLILVLVVWSFLRLPVLI